MNKRHYEHTLPNIRGSLSNTYNGIPPANIGGILYFTERRLPFICRSACGFISEEIYSIKKRNYYFYFEHLLIIFASKNNIYNVTTSQEHP